MADNYAVKDGTGAALTKASKDLGSLVHADKQMAVDSAGGEILGVRTDAASTVTNATSVSMMSVFKQISASIQALTTAFGSAWSRGGGAKDANTQRVTIATDDQLAAVADNADAVSASASLLNNPVVAKLMGWNGSTYDRLQVDGSKNLKIAGAVTNTALTNFGAGEYETVAASATAQALGATGAAGDYISGILVIPATTSPGNVLLLDNATSITVFAGGASSVSNLVPFFIPLGMISVSGAWKITTGTNVSCIGIGNFT